MEKFWHTDEVSLEAQFIALCVPGDIFVKLR